MAKDERQLHELVNSLDKTVNNDFDLGSIIGYAIVSALMDFSTNSGSAEERKILEVREVYAALEAAEISARTIGGYHTLTSLKSQVKNELKEYLEKADLTRAPESFGESKLFDQLVRDMSPRRKNYAEKLRKLGSDIVDEVRQRGRQKGTRNYLERDYRLLEEMI